MTPPSTSELQAQTNALLQALADNGTQAHQDAILLCAVVGGLLIALIVAVLFKHT